ncbi:winged helix-turn-helix domain-containing protein [Pseudoalteromonas sp. SSM20]|uniref:winged helix-turn-helix domain-containing protein n=1 Tax=Pseudoalteromonas sp. SSM20 TaxID=3139394 RepID=UPI003BAA913C
MRVKRDGVWHKVESKQLRLLELLISYQGQAVSRDELLDKIWPNVIVSDNSLSKLVTELRKSIGDDRTDQGIIRTVPRIGYQLIAPISHDVKVSNPIQTKNALIFGCLCLLFGALFQYFLSVATTSEPLATLYQSRVLTQRAGIEEGVSFSSDGNLMVFNYTPINQPHSDLAVMDLQQQTSHIIKDANYSEQAGVFSPDQKWLAYIRSDALQCNIRVVSTASAIETWRLSLDSKLADCPTSLTNIELSWPKKNVMIARFNRQLVRYELTFEPFPRAFGEGKVVINNVDDFSVTEGQLYVLSKQDNTINKYDLLGNIKTALSIDVPNMSFITADKNNLWVGANSLVYYQNEQRLGELPLPLGKLNELTVNPKLETLTLSIANNEIGLFKLENNKLQPISSSMTAALLPTVSASGNKYAYLTQNKHNNQQLVWLRHFNNVSVQYVTSVNEQTLPDILSFSPNGNFLLIGYLDKQLLLIDLATKHSVIIAKGQFDNVHWQAQSEGIFYVKQSGETTQNWYYNLSTGVAEPNAQTRNIDFMLANGEYRTLLNNGYRNYAKAIGEYLAERIYDPLLFDNVVPSANLFSPSVYQFGIYFVVKKGKTLTLYNYEFDSGEYNEVSSLALNGFQTDLPLTITTDLIGQQVIVNQVNNLQSDLVIVEKK